MRTIPDEVGRWTSFTVQQGRQGGLTDKQMRRVLWSSAGRGLRVRAGHAMSLPESTGLLTAATGAVASHETAAALWGFPDLWCDDRVHLLVPLGSVRVRRPGLVIHQALIRDGETVWTASGWCTSRVRTWLDLAERRTVESLVVIGDHLVRCPRPEFEGRSEPYATVADLEEVVRRHPKKRGIVKARTAIPLLRVGADSPPETRLRLRLLDGGLPDFDVNHVIHGPDGQPLHRPDLSNRTYRVAVEYEGEHHGGREQMLRDIRRSRRAAEAGWREVRITASDLSGTGHVAVSAVRHALIARGWPG